MNSQRWIAVTALVLFIVLVSTSPLWLISSKSDEVSPTSTSTRFSADTGGQSSDSTNVGLIVSTYTAPTQDPIIVSLMSEVGIDKLGVGDEPYIIMAGDFTVIDELRKAVGTASIYKIGDIAHALRLDPFVVSAGPDLHVVLSLSRDPRTAADALLPSHVDLGQLKSYSGAQNFDIPNQVNVSRYKSVVIYSLSLNLVYSSASLTQVRG